MAVFGMQGSGSTIDQLFGYSLLIMLLVSSLLNSFVFFYHFKKPRKLISKMFCLLAFSDFMSVALSAVAAVAFLRGDLLWDTDHVSIPQYLISRSQFFFFRFSLLLTSFISLQRLVMIMKPRYTLHGTYFVWVFTFWVIHILISSIYYYALGQCKWEVLIQSVYCKVGFLQYLNSMVLTVVPWYLVCFLAWSTTVILLVLRKKSRPYNTRRNDDINKVVVTIFLLCVVAMLSFLPSLIAFFFHEEYRVVASDKYPLWVWYFCIIYSPALSSFFNPIILVIRGKGIRTCLWSVIQQLARCQKVQLGAHAMEKARAMSLNTARITRGPCTIQMKDRKSEMTKSTGLARTAMDSSTARIEF